MKEQQWLEDGWLFHNHAWHLLHEIIKQIPSNTKSIIDIGAGTGIAAAIIKAVVPDIDVTVCDIEIESKPFWEKRNLNGIVIDQYSMDSIDNNSFDVAISSHVIEHSDNPERFIDDIYRIAKKRIIIACPDGDVHFYDHKTIFNRTVFNSMIDAVLEGRKYTKISFPVYHHHINNLVAVIDKHE